MEMARLAGSALLAAKWFTYTFLCLGDYRRYMALRAGAVRMAVRHDWYEPKHMRFLRLCLRTGETAVDVGANLGAYSISLAQAVGPTGKVLAFEPLAETFEWLCNNTAQWSNVRCFNLALSDRVAESLAINVPLLFGRIPEPSLAGIDASEVKAERRTVRVARLDDYLDLLNGLSFIKVDIEGHELAFLLGARKVLARFRPLVQFEANEIASQYSGFQSFAASLGFTVSTLTPGGYLREFDIPSNYGGCNFYLVPNERLAKNAAPI
jgi:FkbM family methyltransferase